MFSDPLLNMVIITASIVTYKTKINEIKSLMQSIVDSIIDIIYIIDNSPSNELGEFIQELSSKVIYIHKNYNSGFGAAHNIAIHKAITIGSKYHFIINPDIIIQVGVIQSMVSYMQKEKNVGMMMPKILNLDDTPQYLPKLLPSPLMLLCRKIRKPIRLHEYYMNKYELRNINKICSVPVISGCFSLLNLNLFQELNIEGYDERFFMYFEDFDLSRRFYQKCKTIYYPLVSVNHGYAGGAKKNIKLFIIFIHSAIRYFNKWGWFCDKERHKINKCVLAELNMI
jgi:GT2 family glycosyltransferase